jgi:adenosylhomocysteine nucleosidase
VRIKKKEGGDWMKIGILCAGDREIVPFVPMIEGMKVSEKAMLKVYEGTINGIEVAALFSGVCRVNAAIAAQILIDGYGCDVIINAGTAGGMHPSVGLLDVVVGVESVYHDVEVDVLAEFCPLEMQRIFPSDDKLVAVARKTAEKFGRAVHFGRMATGEKFISDDGRNEINAVFAPLSVDMETAAVAHACRRNQIPFIAVRCITDTADHSGDGEFRKRLDQASQISAEFVRRMLHEIRKCS